MDLPGVRKRVDHERPLLGLHLGELVRRVDEQVNADASVHDRRQVVAKPIYERPVGGRHDDDVDVAVGRSCTARMRSEDPSGVSALRVQERTE